MYNENLDTNRCPIFTDLESEHAFQFSSIYEIGFKYQIEEKDDINSGHAADNNDKPFCKNLTF